MSPGGLRGGHTDRQRGRLPRQQRRRSHDSLTVCVDESMSCSNTRSPHLERHPQMFRSGLLLLCYPTISLLVGKPKFVESVMT